MSRLKADSLLLFAGLIWGLGFIAQKSALDDVGPFGFVAARFLISALLIAPLFLKELNSVALKRRVGSRQFAKIFGLCAAFAGGVILQQVGMVTTSVTNTAFITNTYIVLVPFVGFILFRTPAARVTIAASLLSLAGVVLLAGGDAPLAGVKIHHGDVLVLVSALSYAVQVCLLSHVAVLVKAPFTLSFIQYLVAGLAALALAMVFEPLHWQSFLAAWPSILYAGVAAGGIAYTLQAVAQQHTPAADSAIIMSSESLFGALGGAMILRERLTFAGYCGATAILLAILMIELMPAAENRRAAS